MISVTKTVTEDEARELVTSPGKSRNVLCLGSMLVYTGLVIWKVTWGEASLKRRDIISL